MTASQVKRTSLAALGVAAVVGTLAARWRSTPPPQPEAPPPLLMAESRGLNFGDVWASDRFVWKLPIRNTTGSEATLVSLIGNCSCVSIKPLPLRIEAGATAELTLDLDLSKWCSAVPDDSQAVRINFAGVARTGDGESKVGWVLEGRAKHAIRPSRRSVDFGRLWSPAFPLERAIALKLATGVGSVRAEVADDVSGGVSAEVQPTADGSRLVVRLNRVAVPGRYRCEIRLSPTTTSGERLTAVQLPVEWEVLGEIQPDTAAVECGPHPLGTVCERTMTLTSLAGRPFRVTGVETGSAGLRVEMPSAKPASNVTVHVVQRVEQAGDRTAEFTVVGVAATGEPFRVTCRTAYYGMTTTRP